MIKLKTKKEIEKIRHCGIISAQLFKHLKQSIHPGIKTRELDQIAESFIRRHQARPSFKGYMGFPSSICASVNEEIIHGIPCNRVLKEGDIISVDVGIEKDGLISDSAKTFPVGRIKEEHQNLLDRTETALYRAIAQIRSNCMINEIGGAIQDYIKPFKYGIVTEYCGHGVGFENHEEPEIPNYRYKNGKRRLKPGTVIAVEPMINLGDESLFVLEDGWTVVTNDGQYSAHFEHTIAVTEDGFDILTIEPDDWNELKKKYFR